jgi:hypothetical protein
VTPLPAAPPRRSPWGKVLIGCAIVGGLVILAGIAVFVFGMYWLVGSGKHHPTAAVASPRAQGVVRVGDLGQDPGARDLLVSLYKRVQAAGERAGGPQMPAWLRNMQAMQARQGITQWLPREATISLEPDAEDVPRIVLAANLRGFVRPMRLAITQAAKGDRKSTITHHGEQEIVHFDSNTSLCFMDGTLVVSYHPSAMTPALDRLAAAGASPPAGDDRGLPGSWDLNGWLDEHTGTGLLVGLLATDNPPEGEPLRGLRAVRFGIDIENESDARVLTEVAFADAAGAAGGRPWLTEGIGHLRQRLESSGLSSTATDSVEGDRVRLELRLSGVEAAIGRLMEAKENAPRRRSDR